MDKVDRDDSLKIEKFSRKILHESGDPSQAEVSVCITLHQYEDYIVDTLESVYEQDFSDLGLVIVDDCSKDAGPKRAQQWLERFGDRFAYAALASHVQNQGLAASRNAAFELSPSEFILTLDADNQIYPRCVSRLYASLKSSPYGFAYSIIEQFGGRRGLMGSDSWSPELLKTGNYIDAMALIKKSVWEGIGGYSKMNVGGWEDYDFWCRLVEAEIDGLHIPEVLARYRLHSESMLRTETDKDRNDQRVKKEMQSRHPWLDL